MPDEMPLTDFIADVSNFHLELQRRKLEAMDGASKLVMIEARNAIGHDNWNAGVFGPWKDLAQSTIDEKDRLGYFGQVSENDSLLRTGQLRESIQRSFDPDRAIVGSNDDVAVDQEMGTSRIPARPFLSGAASKHAQKIAEIMGRAAVLALGGRNRRVPIPGLRRPDTD